MTKNTGPKTASIGRGERLPAVLSRSQLLELLSMSTTRFDRLVRDGAPISQNSAGFVELNVSAFVEFMIADAVKKATGGETKEQSYDAAKRRDKSAQASMRELELLKVQGSMIEVEDVRPFVREAFGTVRSRVLSVPSQVTGLSPQQRRQIEDAINDALSDLSTDNINLGAGNEVEA